MTMKWAAINEKSVHQEDSQDDTRSISKLTKIEPSDSVTTSNGDPISRKLGDGARGRFTDYRESMWRKYQSAKFRTITTLYAKDKSEINEDPTSVTTPEEAYTRWWYYHSGWHSDDTGRREAKDAVALTQALSDELALTNREKQRALEIILDLKKLRFNRIGGIIAAVLGTLAFVRDESIHRRYDTDDPSDLDLNDVIEQRIVGSEEYQELCDQFDVKNHEAVKKVKKAVD